MYLGKFKTQKEAKQHIRDIIKILPLGITSHPEIINLINYHPNKDEKIGIGIENVHITIDRGNKTIIIERLDKSIVSFSWISCILQQTIEQQEHYDKHQKFREAIQDQIDFFRSNNQSICILCNKAGYCHVDHNYRFIDLIKDFNSNDIVNWKQYHQDNATLRMLCPTCNLTRKKI